MELSKMKTLENLEYVNAFRRWDVAASVRSKPLRVLTEEECQNGLFFTPEMVPILTHELIQARGDDVINRILIYQLYAHLDFTENLEHEVVNKVAYHIGRSRLGLELPCGMIEDAWKLYVDEAYHFMFSADLTKQVEMMTGVQPIRNIPPQFLGRLQRLLSEVPSEHRGLARLFYSIVSETLITGTLSVIPSDDRVVQTVRDVIADHAEDEGRHHAYFAQLLQNLWPQLTRSQQEEMGVLLPEFIFGYLQPDRTIISAWLRELRFTPQETARILEESYPPHLLEQNMRESATVTLKHMERSGVFENDRVLETFLEKGFVLAKS